MAATLLLNLLDIAAELRISERAAERLVRSGQIPSVVVGQRCRRVKSDDLERYVAGLCNKKRGING